MKLFYHTYKELLADLGMQQPGLLLNNEAKVTHNTRGRHYSYSILQYYHYNFVLSIMSKIRRNNK